MTVQVETRAPFRVGIVVESIIQPRWVRRCLEKILAAGVATLNLVIEAPYQQSTTRSLLYNFYKRFDQSLFTATQNACEPVNVEDLFASLPHLRADEQEQIKALDLDVLISFAGADVNAKLAGTAKHGVWFYTFGKNKNDEPGFRELLTRDPLTISSLRSLNRQREQILYQSVSPTLSRFSAGLNNNECYWKAAAFAARSLVDLYHGQNRAHDVTSGESATIATNPRTAQMLLKLSGRAASRVVEKFSSFEQWALAYRFNANEFKYLMPPAAHFWADPFPFEAGGKYYIFFEDYVNSFGKAQISVIEIDRNGIVNGPTEVLKMECHLSYPFVFEWQGACYMIPETGEKNRVELYRAASFPFEWQFEQVLLEANHPVDATLVEVEGTWWMFVNVQEEGVRVNWDELHLYYADNPRGPWKPHTRNPIVSDVRSARPAGRLFWTKNVLCRPSQDSSLRYGYATVINRINRLNPTEYSESEVARIVPNWDTNVIGVHTVNKFKEITVIDCLLKRSRFGKNRGYRSPTLLADLLT